MTFILRMPEARGRRAWRKRFVLWGFQTVVMAIVVVCSAIIVGESIRYELSVTPKPSATGRALVPARTLARVRWAEVKPRLVTRLRQPNPLELGAVWTTRRGRVCGLVHGWGSFGGLTGMTRFYTRGDEPVFKRDGDGNDGGSGFENEWWACNLDRYAMIHEGSDETGYCATRQGRDRCYDVKIQMWGG